MVKMKHFTWDALIPFSDPKLETFKETVKRPLQTLCRKLGEFQYC